MLTPQQIQEMQNLTGLKPNPTPVSDDNTQARIAELDAMVKPTLTDKFKSVAGEIINPVERLGASVAQGIHDITGIGTNIAGDNSQATGLFGNKVDLLGTKEGQALDNVGVAKDIAGNIAQNAAMVAPVGKVGSIASGIKAGAVAGGLYGAGKGLEEQKDLGGVVKSGLEGAALGGALGGAIPGASQATGIAKEKLAQVSAQREAKRAEDATNLVGQIVQGKKADINKAKEALTSIDTTGIKTYEDLVNALDDKIHSISKAQDTVFEKHPQITKINDLATKVKVGDEEITHNYVSDAISQLKDLYSKTNDVASLAKVNQLEQKAGSEGLSVKELNDLARLHGQDLNAFNANGQAASGLSKQAAENTRVGLKQTAKGIFDNPVYNESDRQMSNLIKTRDLVKNVSEKVNQLQQKIQDRSLGAKVGVALGKAINLLGLGTPKGIVEALIPRGQGFKVMNALDLQETLSKNLGKIQEALGGKTEEDIIQKLESITPH